MFSGLVGRRRSDKKFFDVDREVQSLFGWVGRKKLKLSFAYNFLKSQQFTVVI